MEKIIVYGGNKLQGTVKIEGAKNAVLPILAATLLVEKGVTTLKNVPNLTDVHTMINVIRGLNADVVFNEDINEITVHASENLKTEASREYVSQIRASVVVLGPLLARYGHAKVALPGGCSIGKRPIDLHLKGFKALGARIIEKNDSIEAIAEELVGNYINLDYPSIGATQNIMMISVKAKGTTVIENAARELEIVELADVLNKMGADIKGAGSDVIIIKGVNYLQSIEHTIVQDRIEAGTFMIAAAMTEGNVLIKDAILEHNRPLCSKLTEMGVTVFEDCGGVRVIGLKRLKPVDVKTLPHPGFPTDLQAQMAALQILAEGTSVLTETVFENRFQHLIEMRRMNADVEIDGNIAIINGGQMLKGANVRATDLRAAAGLILLGLCAEGVTKVSNLKYLDRGYYKFHRKLQKLGAKVARGVY